MFYLFAGSKRIATVFLDGTTQFYHTNHLGSSSVITDQYGGKKEQIEYYPFGLYRAVGHINGTYDFDPNFPDVYYTFTGQEDDDDLGLYNYGARLYDPVLGRFISPDSIVQAPDDPQTLNRYSYARNNPLIYVDPSGEFFAEIILAISSLVAAIVPSTAGITAYTVAATITYAAVGAALGAATSAITGGNIGLGALTGAISGFIFYGAGSIATGISGALNATSGSLGQVAITAGVHTAAGAVSGGINSAITGSDIGLGMLTGAVGAGIGAVTGGALTHFKVEQFGYNLVARTVAGGIAGGIVSEIYGGNFWQGFAQGAATAAAGFLFNCAVSKMIEQHPAVKGASTFPFLKGKLMYPGQIASKALLPGAVIIEGSVLAGAGALLAPELAALTVKYGTIYIYGSPNTWQFGVDFIQGLAPTLPPVSWGGLGGFIGGRAYDWWMKVK